MTSIHSAVLTLVLTLGLLAAAIGSGRAAGPEGLRVSIVTADLSDETKQIIEGLRRRFPAAETSPVNSAHPAHNRSAALIAVGPAALRGLLEQRASGVIVSVFASSAAFQEIVKDLPAGKGATVTAVFADPSPLDQMRLISAIYKRRVRVGVLLSERTMHLLPVLTRSARQAELDLVVEALAAERSINEPLARLAGATVLLAVPDRTTYHADNVRNILLTTYRRNQPLIGFSSAFVKAGALASTYSSVDEVAAQVGEILDEWKVSGRLPEPDFPKYFEVAINDMVARSLDLVIDDGARKMARNPGVGAQ